MSESDPAVVFYGPTTFDLLAECDRLRAALNASERENALLHDELAQTDHRAAVLAEREACAVLAEQLEPVHRVFQSRGLPLNIQQQIAEAIRNRTAQGV